MFYSFTFPFSHSDLVFVSCLASTVNREQHVPPEKLVLSGASWNSRLWTLPGGSPAEPGPRPLRPEGWLLQLPQEQRSVSGEKCWMCGFCRGQTRWSPSKAVSRQTETGACTSAQWRAQTKCRALRGMPKMFPQQWNGSSPAPQLFVCLSLRVLICYSQICTLLPPHDHFHLEGQLTLIFKFNPFTTQLFVGGVVL